MKNEKNMKFKLLRTAHGKTQQRISVETGIHVAKISFFENGLAMPDSEEIKSIASSLGCKQAEVKECFGEGENV